MTFFHRSVLKYKKRNTIRKLVNNDNVELTDEQEIGRWSTRYFQDIYKPPQPQFDMLVERNLLGIIHLVVDERRNKELVSKVTEDEVRKAIFSMGAFKAPSPDGVPLAFFQEFYEIIKYNFFDVTRDFLRTSRILKELNQNFLALVSKFDNPTHMEDFKPISLCNTIYKIISKWW